MDEEFVRFCTAFAGPRIIATGTVPDVARSVRTALDDGQMDWLAFDDETGRLVELDLRGSVEEVVRRYPSAAPPETSDGPPPGPVDAGDSEPRRGRGRPRLGVVGKEVTLLPRHWAWLGAQRGGASATLRRLVEQARRDGARGDAARRAQDATYRFTVATVGNEPGFEEATRALFAGDEAGFQRESESWSPDLRSYARKLARSAFASSDPSAG